MEGQLRKLIWILWFGFLSAILLGPVTYFYQDEIKDNIYLIVLALFFSLPVGITYLYLLGEIIKSYKYKLLFGFPLILLPRLFVLFIALAPFIYLIYITITRGAFRK